MTISLLNFIFGVPAAYFGFKLLRIIPTLFQLLAALYSGACKWPGPRIHDTDHNASIVRERLGAGYQNLFSTFIWNTSSSIGAFGFYFLMFLSSTTLLSGYVVIKSSWMLYALTFILFVGGISAFEKTEQNKNQVNTILSDLANKVEPRAIDGQSAKAEYAIEHPVIMLKNMATESRWAFNLYYESVSYHQEGNEARALTLYNEALRINPSLHQDAQGILSMMLSNCSLEGEGAICYWLGIHSEYLSDRRQAAIWYKKAALAFNKIGYKKRESRAHCNLGNVKMQMGDPNGMEEFEKAIALDPKNGTAYLNIARIYYSIGYSGDYGYEQALNAFADAIVADPLTYGPDVISSLREIGYTWERDLEEITKRVEAKHRSKKTT
jgi:tetratricopeptide (TPR) repeat protein